MQTIVAGLMALTAMGASILADVDPLSVVMRGGVAYVAGLLLTGVWNVVVGPPKSDEKKSKKAKEPKAPKKKKGDGGPKGEPAEVSVWAYKVEGGKIVPDQEVK